MIIGLPSGIGDVSWAYSKLCHVGPLEYEIADGWPYRTSDFMELLPGVSKVSYGQFRYEDIMSFEHATGIGDHPKWEDVVSKNGQPNARVLIAPNLHLEQGRRLEEWLPDLPTDFHYPINIPEARQKEALNILSRFKKPVWGISAASYRGSESWKTWGRAEWTKFLWRFHDRAGGTILLLGGFWDDLTHSLAEDGWNELVGKTHISTATEILKHLDGYIGFSSGLGVLRTVLNKRVFMMWPDHQLELSTSWAPKHMLESGRYMMSRWLSPDEVFVRVKLWLQTPNDAESHG